MKSTVGDEALVSWFSELTNADRDTVGGKGASLGELQSAGLPVPPGFVVTTAGFREAEQEWDPEGELTTAIEAVDPADLNALQQVALAARNRVKTAPIPQKVKLAISEAYEQLQQLHPGPVAVRSSATAEDGDDASFAGLQDTILWVLDINDTLEAIRSCWASMYTDESIAYRRRLALPESEIAMGVVVQVMVNARAAGVMFTRSPTTGDKSVVAIESSWGLGSALVSGEVTPDKYTVSKVTGTVTKKVVSPKTIRHVPNKEKSGVCVEAVPDDMQQVPSLTSDHIQTLWEMARRAEKHYGKPVDIEWAVDEGATDSVGVKLLQCRPETIWSTKEEEQITAPGTDAMSLVFNLYSGGHKKTHS